MTEALPLISIVLPVYNGGALLRESVESCLNQTHPNLELIIVDDCSTDNTGGIAAEYVRRDPRVRYVRNEHNQKLPASLNRGFDMARGDYLTWTSHDNAYAPDALAEMLAQLRRPGAEFVFADCVTVDDAGNRKVIPPPPEDHRAIWEYNFVGACFLYTRKARELVGDYDTGLFLCEDYDYWLRMFARVPVTHLDRVLYTYRLGADTLTATRQREQYAAKERTLAKNFPLLPRPTMVHRYYLAHALHDSRTLCCGFFRRNRYLPMLVALKLWHRLFGTKSV